MKFRPSPNLVPLLATVVVCLLLYAAASLKYEGFFSARVATNFFSDNAFLGIAAIGMTFVILSGGIDLSVGSVVAVTSILVATLTTKHHLHPTVVIPTVLFAGAAFGAAMGCLIQFFNLAPFFVTLAGMFLARGVGQIVSLESVSLDHPVYVKLSEWTIDLADLPVPFMQTHLHLADAAIPLTAILFIAVALVG